MPGLVIDGLSRDGERIRIGDEKIAIHIVARRNTGGRVSAGVEGVSRILGDTARIHDADGVQHGAEVPGWPAISSPFQWVTATLHYKVTKEFQVYVEGKNLTDSVARTYLNGNPLLPWAPGQLVGQSASGVGAGYSAYGRTYTVGASYQF
jgi:outer membrane receptor protein involved in Fe transport